MAKKSVSRFVPHVEELESRLVPAIFTVNTVGDLADATPGDGVAADKNGDTSLRAAIMEAEALGGKDEIRFNIQPAGTQTITLTSALPTIESADGLVIDGTYQPGYDKDVARIPKIVLDGSMVLGATGLTFNAGKNTVRGLVILGFGIGIDLKSDGNIVENNLIGINEEGKIDAATMGNGTGIRVFNASNNTIGGKNYSTFNVLSGNTVRAITIDTDDNGKSTNNLVVNNRINTDLNGNELRAAGDGILISGNSTGNNIGAKGYFRNVIASNDVGVDVAANNNVVAWNIIGLNRQGMSRTFNKTGIRVSGNNNIIGGEADVTYGNPALGEKSYISDPANVISGSQEVGLSISGQDNLVQGNFIGLRLDGSWTEESRNVGGGVSITGTDNLIGGALNEVGKMVLGGVGRANVISNNGIAGVYMATPAAGNTLMENIIGLSPDRRTAIGNFAPVAQADGIGIKIEDSDSNKIGLDVPSGNFVANPGALGVVITGKGSIANSVNGNVISDANTGIQIKEAGRQNHIRNNEYPNTKKSVENIDTRGTIIQSNLFQGAAEGAVFLSGTGTSEVLVSENTITGAQGVGVAISDSASGNTVERNEISGTAGDAIRISGGTRNVISQNTISLTSDMAIDLGDDGPTANDTLDLDSGPNDLQNKPVFTSILSSGPGSTVTIQGYLSSEPNKNYLLEFFGNSSLHPLGYGEGEEFVGDLTVTTDALGLATFSFTSAPTNMVVFSATATSYVDDDGDPNTPDVLGNTSEYADPNPLPLPVVSIAADDPAAAEAGPDTGSFVVTRDVPGVTDLTVYYTISGTASNGGDYVALTGSVLIPAGQTSAPIITTPIDDGYNEGAETVVLTISGDPNYIVSPDNEATVSITDDDVHGPIGVADGYIVHQGQTLTVPTPGVLANESDPDGDPLSAILVSNPSYASYFVFNSDGSFEYTRAYGYDQDDFFLYTVYDGTQYSEPVTVYLHFVNVVPVGNADSYNVHQGQTTLGNVLANDTDADAQDTLTAELVTNPSYASFFVFNSDGSFQYTRAYGYDLDDSFIYRVYDGAQRSVDITVSLDFVNAVPVGATESYSVSEGDTVLDNVLLNDSDADAQDTLTALLVTNPSYASYFAFNADGSFEYTRAYGYDLDDSFVYRAYDGAQYSEPITVTFGFVGAAVSGRAWLDTNQNGIQDTGEGALVDVIVRLFRDGAQVATFTTGADGTYRFDNLIEGTYQIAFEKPDYAFSPQDQGTDDTTDSDVDADGLSAFFALYGADVLDHLDAGLYSVV